MVFDSDISYSHTICVLQPFQLLHVILRNRRGVLSEGFESEDYPVGVVFGHPLQ